MGWMERDRLGSLAKAQCRSPCGLNAYHGRKMEIDREQHRISPQLANADYFGLPMFLTLGHCCSHYHSTLHHKMIMNCSVIYLDA